MSNDITPPEGTDVARHDDVAAEMVKVMRERHPELRAIPARDLVTALAELLPVYGAMVQVRTFGHDYERRERHANSLTTRVYGVSLLQRVAAEAERDANAGIDAAANRAVARVLRERAKTEGRP
jgi:hypothetical protein